MLRDIGEHPLDARVVLRARGRLALPRARRPEQRKPHARHHLPRDQLIALLRPRAGVVGRAHPLDDLALSGVVFVKLVQFDAAAADDRADVARFDGAPRPAVDERRQEQVLLLNRRRVADGARHVQHVRVDKARLSLLKDLLPARHAVFNRAGAHVEQLHLPVPVPREHPVGQLVHPAQVGHIGQLGRDVPDPFLQRIAVDLYRMVLHSPPSSSES